MKVLVAGATGVMGRQLVPRLVDAGHEVFAMIRKESDKAAMTQLGAVPVIADALDRAAVDAAMRQASPEVVVHQLTAIRTVDPRHMEQSFAATDQLRTKGTDNLLAAARAVGVRRFVAQSNGGFTYARTGGPVKTERDPLDSEPVRSMASMIAAVSYLEKAVLGADWTEGIVLRYGAFYGPGTSMAPGSGRSSTSPTPPRRRSPPWRRAAAASTTSPMTSPPRSPSGCRNWPRCWAPRSRCGCRGSSGGWRPDRPASC